MQARLCGIEMSQSTRPSAEQIAQPNFQPDESDKEGNFQWFFGRQSHTYPTAPTTAPHKKEKFHFLANMGLLPDNDILSNKLINIYGKRIFSLIHDKGRTLEEKSFRKKAGLALGLSHAKFSPSKRMDLQACWTVVKKIRAIQKLDMLLNTTSADFQKNYIAIRDATLTAINTLKERISIKEYHALVNDVKILFAQLSTVKNQDQYRRNQIIQAWQRDTFLRFNADFQIQEGHIGLAEMSAPLARENISNSVIHTEVRYAIQEHVYAEWQPVTPTQLWLVDDETCGDMLSSAAYCTNSRQRKELLLGACISEELAKSNSFDRIDQIKEEDLVAARACYQRIKLDLQTASCDVKNQSKDSKITHAIPLIKHFFTPQIIDEQTGLSLTSREFSRYKRSVQLQLGARKKLDHNLHEALQSLRETIDKQGKDIYPNPIQADHIPPQKPSTLNAQHAPFPQRALPVKNDDGLSATLDFINTFLLFFDKDLMAKRPYVAMFFFSLPCMQLTFPILGSAFSSGLFTQITSAIFSVEANLAKYTGLNLFLKAILHHEITAESLEYATTAVREAVTWFTCAESLAEKVMIGSLIAKISFNLGDLLLNNPLVNPDAALLSEYWTTLFPDSSGSLENTTALENLKNLTMGLFRTLAQLSIAAFAVGGLQHFIPGMDLLLSPLANVPWDKIAPPHSVQALGISKASALILLKTFGILEQIEAGQLIDIDGYKIRENNNSFKLLVMFLELAHCSPKYRQNLRAKFSEEPATYQLAREHFQELLAHNPNLWEMYRHNGTYQNLKELGLKKIAPKRRHKYLMACLKTLTAFLQVGIGILPAIFLTLPLLLMSAVKKISPYALLPNALKPLYQYGLESLNFYVKIGKISWTLGKAILHPFIAVGARCAEIGVSALFLPFFLAATVLRPFGWLANKGFHRENNPVTDFLVKPLLKGHAIVAGWLREHLRYPIERRFDAILRACRDVFVRKVEREIQVGTLVEENNIEIAADNSPGSSTFNTLKALTVLTSSLSALKADPCVRLNSDIDSAKQAKFFTPNKASRSLSYPHAQTESATTPHHLRATVRSHG